MHPYIGLGISSSEDPAAETDERQETSHELADTGPADAATLRRIYDGLRRYAETRFERERIQLEAVIHSLGDGLVAFDSGGKLLFSNAAAQAHLGSLQGRNIKELLTHSFRMRSPEFGGEVSPRHLETILTGDLPFRSDDAELLWDGPIPLPVSCVLNPIRDGDNTVGWVFVFRDMSRPRRQEEELERARSEAERANRAKSEFLAVMSHEIRTPMNGVIGMTNLLSETPLSDEQQDYTDTIRRSGEALLSIINDILDFSKVEAGHLQLEKHDFEPRLLVEEVVELLADASERKGLELVAWIDEDVPAVVHGDAGRLRQVLVNLVGNAIKFTHEGDVVVHVRREPSELGCDLHFEVRDTGIGIPEKDLEDIFQSFSQGSRPNRRSYGGTGLGLAISRRLVDLMRGRIGAQPRAQGGTTFWFNVILGEAQDEVGSRPQAFPGTPRVLLACANGALRGMLKELLPSLGIQVTAREDSTQLTDQLRAAADRGQPFDLAILDADLAPEGGWQLAQWLAADPQLQDCPRVVLTTQRALIELDPGQRQSAPHVLKPTRPRQLLKLLRAALAEDTAHSAGPAHGEAVAKTLSGEVLVVEDNAVSQRLAGLVLEKLGCSVTKASDGHEALEVLATRSFELILMDCQMPGLDGFETTRMIRKLEAGSGYHTPIVAMTASAMPEDRQACLEAGMDDYLTKPLRRDELLGSLGRWLATPVS